MAITVKNLSEIFGKDVFTTRGVYCGKVEDVELSLQKFRIRSLLIEAAKGSFLSGIVSGKRGVILPYQLVESVGDVVIIKHITAPSLAEETSKMDEKSEESQSIS
ncbi:MAG: PRC-barrel domain-containing protein, partial [Thermanaerothrix sp.]|nr:PRC-barrel domain-containing protein [Thermanaerothrix sp.]